jgi:hypothetical protein
MKNTTAMNMVLIAALAVSASACGRAQRTVLDLSLTTSVQNADQFVEMKALLDTGNLNFGATVPIYDPKHPEVTYGSVSLYPGLKPRTSELTLSVNLTTAARAQGADAKVLPNGAPIPVGGLGNATAIGLMAGKRSRVYLAFDHDVAVIGTALVIKEFDEVGKYAPGVNIFPSFELGKGIWGTAGIFTSAEKLQSGIGIFVDASSVLNGGNGNGGQTPPPSELSFGAPSTVQQEGAAAWGLYRLDRKAARVNVK